MIKTINQQNLLTTPFVAAKNWNLFNSENDDLVLLESTSSDDSLCDTLALDFIDYSITGSPFVNSTCSIALEQQSNDLIIYQEGQTGSGHFLPNSEPTNRDGSYKRLVHNQIETTFYNNYGNPLKIWGAEFIDFPLGQTFRNISDFIRVFTIPQDVFGERVLENTITFQDNTLDDNVTIFDDGFQNLIAGTNLFSKVQEVRSFGNIIEQGTSSFVCPAPALPLDLIFVTSDQVGNTLPSHSINSIIAVGTTLYCTDGNNFYSSPNGYSWTLVGNITNVNTINGLAYGSGVFVAVGISQSIYYSSNNGAGWSAASYSKPTVSPFYDVAYGNGAFSAVGAVGELWVRSTDGINWSRGFTISGDTYYSEIYAGGLFVRVGSGFVSTSPDGLIDWNYTPLNGIWISGTPTMYGVTYDGTKYISVGSVIPALNTVFPGTSALLTSSNGTSWGPANSHLTESLMGIANNNAGQYVAVSEQGNVYSSTDGINWTFYENKPGLKLIKIIHYTANTFVILDHS